LDGVWAGWPNPGESPAPMNSHPDYGLEYEIGGWQRVQFCTKVAEGASVHKVKNTVAGAPMIVDPGT